MSWISVFMNGHKKLELLAKIPDEYINSMGDQQLDTMGTFILWEGIIWGSDPVDIFMYPRGIRELLFFNLSLRFAVFRFVCYRFLQHTCFSSDNLTGDFLFEEPGFLRGVATFSLALDLSLLGKVE